MNLNIKLNKYRSRLSEEVLDTGYDDDDTLAPVMPAIDAVQQLMEQENKLRSKSREQKLQIKSNQQNESSNYQMDPKPSTSKQKPSEQELRAPENSDKSPPQPDPIPKPRKKLSSELGRAPRMAISKSQTDEERHNEDKSSPIDLCDNEEPLIFRNNPLSNFAHPNENKQDEYEFIPKSVTLDVYSNDPEVRRFLKQLPRICNETGYNEQDYKCYSCRRPIGLAFSPSRLCHFDGHHYCSECHLGDKSVIPARVLCNWDFNKYPVSKRNQHFLTLISNESMFELKKVAPLLYKVCPELREVEELRHQAFFVRSYCMTCVQDSISFELTKLIWPREHLVKQTDLYSLEDLIQIKSGALKQVLKSVITFGRQHVLSCVLCCQKGFICELCKSSQIIYPFDTESVYRCNGCQSIYHKACFKSKQVEDACPRCERLKARRVES